MHVLYNRNLWFAGTPLTLKAAVNALHSVCFKWRAIGVQLEVPTFQLKIIEKKSCDLTDQLCDTLDYWMNSDSSSWRHLVDALKAPSVGENRLAEEIEEKYCGLEEESSCDEPVGSVHAKCHQGTYVCFHYLLQKSPHPQLLTYSELSLHE